jgi:hypothetical protein
MSLNKQTTFKVQQFLVLNQRSEYTYAAHSLKSKVRSFLAIHYETSLITNFVRLDPS